MATRTVVRSQVRGFAVIWTTITVLIGIATFFAIYLAYDNEADSGSTITLPQQPQEDTGAVAAIPTTDATPVPTLELTTTPVPTATDEPTEVPVVVADASSAEDVTEEDAAEVSADTTADEVTEDTTTDDATIEETAPESDTTENTDVQQTDDDGADEETVTEEPVEEELPPIAQTEFLPSIQVQYSLDFNPDVQRAWMNDVGGLGLDTFKQQVRWEEIELEPGEYNWAKLDLVVPIAEEYGYNIIGSVVAAPDWAREPGADLTQDGPPANLQDFANFLEAMLERYPGQFFAIEVWNEPNLEREWASPNGLSAERFVEMNRIAYETIKNIDPGIIVISGALSPTGGFVTPEGRVTAIDDFQYTDDTIAAGLLNYTDCVGAHHNGINVPPYYRWDEIPPDPDAQYRGPFDNPHHSWSFLSTLETYANKIAVAGGDQRLCVTEFGWASVDDLAGFPPGFEFALDITLEEQAEYVVAALEFMEESEFVWIASIWNLNYGPQAGWSTDSDNTPYSFIGPEFVKRPVYAAVQAWNAERQQ